MVTLTLVPIYLINYDFAGGHFSHSHNFFCVCWVSISSLAILHCVSLSLSLSFSLLLFLFHLPLLILSLRVFLFLHLLFLSVVDHRKPLSLSLAPVHTFFSAMLRRSPSSELSLLLLLCYALLLPSLSLAESDRLETTNSTEMNVSLSKPKEGSFADMIDQALSNEFPENDQPEGS